MGDAPITFRQFWSLAWEAANEKARDLGWVKSCDESQMTHFSSHSAVAIMGPFAEKEQTYLAL